jgi:hypothetical protein
MARPLIDYLILDSVADDIESLEQIVPSLSRAVSLWEINPPDGHFSREEVALSITRLVRDKLIEGLAPNPGESTMSPIGEGVQPRGNLDDYWFQLTGRGRIVHNDWIPPAEREKPSRFAT